MSSIFHSMFLHLYIELYPALASLSGKCCETNLTNPEMPPSSSQETPEAPRRYCGIAPHLLKAPNRKITDERFFRFVKRVNPEMRMSQAVCMACYNKMKDIYRMKMANARRHEELRRQANGNGNSVSDVSNSQRMESSTDSSVANPPRSGGGVTMRRKLPTVSPPSPQSSSATSEPGPSTSTSAAAKRKRTSGDASPDAPAPPQPAAASSTSYVSDDDDANSNLSLNAVNGTRLPNIQPIPKRRQFVHLNKKAMDIYLAGTTGG